MNNTQLFLKPFNIMKKNCFKIGIISVFAVMIMCISSVSSFAQVIFSENYDSIASGWNCSKATPSNWSNGSACTSRSIGGVSHYGGEISSGGRSGNSLKQWKGPGTTESGYDGYLNKIFSSTEFVNHYKGLNSKVYVRIDPQLDNVGCTGESPKFMGRIYAGSTADGSMTNYQVLLDLRGSTMKSSVFHVYIVGASAPFDNIYSTASAASLGLFDGNWHSVEIGVKASSAGQSNGEVHLYIDGKELQLTGGSGESPSVGQTHIAFNWPDNVYITWPMVPGVGNLTPEGSAQWTTSDNQWGSIEWDDFVVSTTYIGPDGGSTTAPPVSTPAPDTTKPTTPSGLSASATSSSQINLSWAASTDNVGVTGYKIYRSGTYIATTTGTSYTNTGLTAATSYSYKVSAIDAAGNESSQCSSVNATTLSAVVTDTTAPSRPSGLSASASSSSQINLSWTASTDNIAVTGYKIYRAGTYIATSTGTSYTNTGLTASTSYSYNVSAIDAAGNESSQSSSASATTQAAATSGRWGNQWRNSSLPGKF